MRFWKNENGAALVYVTGILLAIFGLTALSIDAGRFFNLRNEVQQAADAAALAGAWQLDGTLAGSQNATIAARTAPVVTNTQRFGNAPGAVAIAATDYWRGVPASDDAPLTLAAPPYDFIRVTTTGVVQNTLLMQAMGAGPTTTVTARAVARKGQAICQVTPLFMCLPNPATFDPNAYIGRQVLMKAAQGNSWTNGNWGLLDTPGGSQSAGALANMIAGVNGLPQCIGTGVDTKPGNVASISPAFNIRFDMYENLPGNVNHRTSPGYPPAEHVQKGRTWNASCNNYSTINNNLVPKGFPRDSNISNANRFGNGQWNCLSYWQNAHPGNTANIPPGCSSTGGITRYEVYLHEITNNLIPDLRNIASNPKGDNGNSRQSGCYTGGPIPTTPTAPSQRVNDRRILVVAGVDCSSIAINGNTPNVPVLHYLSMFITEPAGTQGQTNGDVYMEIVGSDAAGGGGLAPIQLREWVELVR